LHRESGTSPWLRLRSDEQLVGLFRSGSEEAFRVIHDRYRARLFAYARQMLAGSGPDAEDVMQDVFLRAYRALRVDERPVSLRAWLYKVAHNRCIDSLRRPTPAPADIFELSRTPVQDPLAEAERREDLQRLIADVRRLPDQQRSALLMREMVGMSYADLAAALETSVPAVKSLLVRARIGLVEAIEARDTDCADIRLDLAASYDRGVRTSGRARRHLRDCSHCTTYREQLRGVRHGFAALNPAGAAPGLLAKLLGLSGAGSGAAAGGAAGGTTVAVGGAAAVSVTKVAAIVCCAAVVSGGALELPKVVAHNHKPPPAKSTAPAVARAAAAPAAVAAVVTELRHRALPSLERHSSDPVRPAEDLALHPPLPMTPSLSTTKEGRNGSGGALAPSETAPTDEDAATTEGDSTAAPPSDSATTDDDGNLLDLPTDPNATSGSGTGTGSSSSTGSSTSGSGSSSSTSGSGSGDNSATTASTSGSSTSGSSTSGSGTSGSSDPSSGDGSSSGGSSTISARPRAS
jgi:RNA polymerase sigma factor (sigma-70 family)